MPFSSGGVKTLSRSERSGKSLHVVFNKAPFCSLPEPWSGIQSPSICEESFKLKDDAGNLTNKKADRCKARQNLGDKILKVCRPKYKLLFKANVHIPKNKRQKNAWLEIINFICFIFILADFSGLNFEVLRCGRRKKKGIAAAKKRESDRPDLRLSWPLCPCSRRKPAVFFKYPQSGNVLLTRNVCPFLRLKVNDVFFLFTRSLQNSGSSLLSFFTKTAQA